MGADQTPTAKFDAEEPPTTTPADKKKPGLLDRVTRKKDKKSAAESITGEPTTDPAERKKRGLLDFISKKRTSTSPKRKLKKSKKGKKADKEAGNLSARPKKSTVFK